MEINWIFYESAKTFNNFHLTDFETSQKNNN